MFADSFLDGGILFQFSMREFVSIGVRRCRFVAAAILFIVEWQCRQHGVIGARAVQVVFLAIVSLVLL